MRDGDADLADLAAREDVVRIVSGLGGQVEGDREAGLTFRKVGLVKLVRRAGRRVTGIGPHQPRAIRLRTVDFRVGHIRAFDYSFTQDYCAVFIAVQQGQQTKDVRRFVLGECL